MGNNKLTWFSPIPLNGNQGAQKQLQWWDFFVNLISDDDDDDDDEEEEEEEEDLWRTKFWSGKINFYKSMVCVRWSN